MHENIHVFQLWDEMYDLVTGKRLQIIDTTSSQSLFTAYHVIMNLLSDFHTYPKVYDTLKLFTHEDFDLYVKPHEINQELNNQLIGLLPEKLYVHVFYDAYRHKYYRDIEAMITPCGGIVLNFRYITEQFSTINSA